MPVLPSHCGNKPSRAMANSCRDAAYTSEKKVAIRPNTAPQPITLASHEPSPKALLLDIAAYSGSPAEPTSSTPPAPGAHTSTTSAVTSNVPMAARMPRGMVRPGLCASSAAEPVCSTVMNSQMANGTQAKIPPRLTGVATLAGNFSKLANSTWGAMATPNVSRATTAITPAMNVRPMASPTPRMWMPMITANRAIFTGQPPRPKIDSV
ncbi:hypothetical protein D9M71_324390 [compost metagenome]